MYYSGIDLHSDNWYITTIDENGAVVKQQRLENIDNAVLEYFHCLPGAHQAVVESTTGWYWLNDLLVITVSSSFWLMPNTLKPSVMLKLKQIKSIRKHWPFSYVKASFHKLTRSAANCAASVIPCVSVLRLVQQRSDTLRRLKSIHAKFNGFVPDPYHFQLAALEHIRDSLTEQILALEKSLHPMLIPNDDIQRLLYIPGIGKLSAFTIYLEIDGIERFVSDKHFLSYCRLVPAAENSNRTKHHRSSKDGNKYLKIAFADAAVHAIQYYAEYKRFYQKRARRSGEAIARACVAKELAKMVFYILKNKSQYKGFKGQQMSRQKSLQWPRVQSPET